MGKITDDASTRIVLYSILIVVVLWLSASVLGLFERPVNTNSNKILTSDVPVIADETMAPEHDGNEKKIHIDGAKSAMVSEDGAENGPEPDHQVAHESSSDALHVSEPLHPVSGHSSKDISVHKSSQQHPKDSLPLSKDHQPSLQISSVSGVEFVRAAIKPLAFELDERFWGWRPNDIINVTDNVNNFQLAVLEVTRRTAVILAERISRTGSSASFDINLERAMNWFMIKADRYWFPSPESKYRAGIKELNAYIEALENDNASFYTRADTLLPLLKAYENLLGSCDENLVKPVEEDGTSVSFFKADDYFYYAKGVASAMGPVLEAVNVEFHSILESRNGLEVLHHAIDMCHDASQLEPWIITDADLEGFFANHRANMAALISHARFYLGVLVTIMST